jgi:hypothetical protein
MSDPKTAPSTPPLYVAPARGPFSGRGRLDLLILAALAIGSALTALHYITAKETVKIDAPTGPLTHLDDPADPDRAAWKQDTGTDGPRGTPPPPPAPTWTTNPAPDQSVPTPATGDQPVQVQPAK